MPSLRIHGSAPDTISIIIEVVYVATSDRWYCRKRNWLEGVTTRRSITKRHRVEAAGGRYEVLIDPDSDVDPTSRCDYAPSSVGFLIVPRGEDPDGAVTHALLDVEAGGATGVAQTRVSCHWEALSAAASRFLRCEADRGPDGVPGDPVSPGFGEALVDFTVTASD